MNKAAESRVKKVSLTGSASSVVGLKPNTLEDYIYTEPYSWADKDSITKPNEKAKYLSEIACWNTIKKLD